MVMRGVGHGVFALWVIAITSVLLAIELLVLGLVEWAHYC